jgi:elongation factor 1 alpha-like protein
VWVPLLLISRIPHTKKLMTYLAHPMLLPLGSCSGFSASEFFQDSPWLSIPPHRRGEIVIEPLYPRGGLLGGSSSSTGAATPNPKGGKMSKLAALAAARKKEHGKASGDSESAGQPQSSAINLLSKLGQKPKDTSKTETQQTQLEGDGARKTNNRKYPTRRRKSLERKEPELEPSPECTSPKAPEKPKELKPEDVQAKPSFFAMAILGRALERPKEMGSRIDDTFKLPYITEEGFTNLDIFKGPSPDDVVIAAQKKTGKGAIQIACGKSYLVMLILL